MTLRTLEEALEFATSLSEALEVGKFIKSKSTAKHDDRFEGAQKIINVINIGSTTWYEIKTPDRKLKRVAATSVEQWVKVKEAGDPNLKIGDMIRNPKGRAVFGDQSIDIPRKILKVTTAGSSVWYEIKNKDRKLVRISSDNAVKA